MKSKNYKKYFTKKYVTPSEKMIIFKISQKNGLHMQPDLARIRRNETWPFLNLLQ